MRYEKHQKDIKELNKSWMVQSFVTRLKVWMLSVAQSTQNNLHFKVGWVWRMILWKMTEKGNVFERFKKCTFRCPQRAEHFDRWMVFLASRRNTIKTHREQVITTMITRQFAVANATLFQKATRAIYRERYTSVSG